MKKAQAKEYKVKKYSVGSDERVLKIEGGRDLNTKVNVGTMLKLLGGSIYKSNVSAFREQLVNAISHGCIAANESEEYKDDNEAFVEVKFDFNKRRVTITDVNGMGIPWNVMDQVVTSLGDSGNEDRTRAGQFGCGMFSFIRMADTTILETYSKETDEHYAYISEGSKWHEIENRELNETGTRIMITFKPEVDMLELVESCKVISDFQPVDVIVRVQGWQKVVTEEKVSDYGRQKADNKEWFKGNGVYRLGKNEMGADLIDRTQERYSQPLSDKDIVKLVDKDNDIEVFFTLPTTVFDGYGSLADQYLCNIPIGGGIEFSGMPSVRINFTNEKTWSPPVDRDRLTDESMKTAEKIVSSMITGWLKNIEIKSIDDFKKHQHKNIINSRRLDEYLNEETLDVLHALRQQYVCWKYVPDESNASAEYMRKHKPRTRVTDMLAFNNKNIFSTPKIDKRLYNLFAQHFPDGFMFIIGHPDENTIKDLSRTEINELRESGNLYENTLNGYLETHCGIEQIEDATIYKKQNGLKSLVVRGSTKRSTTNTLSVVARNFSYYGHSDTYELSGRDVNKSLIWLKDKNYITFRNIIQSQYYNGNSDFTFRGVKGNLKQRGSREESINQTLFNVFWESHKFIVKQVPKNIQNAVTEFQDFRDSVFATKLFTNTDHERVSLIEIIRKVHPELKDFNRLNADGEDKTTRNPETGQKGYEIKIITNRELFDNYCDLEEPEHDVFYIDLNFRPTNNKQEFGFLSNLYMAMFLTNLEMSGCWQDFSGYHSGNAIERGIAINFNEDLIRRELFAKNDLYDKFKYMDQNAPSDFLDQFESFNKKFSKNFSQPVMDLTCYLLSTYHSGMNTVFHEHNNQLTNKSTILFNPSYIMMKDCIVVDENYNSHAHLSYDKLDQLSLQTVYYTAAKLVETFIEKQIEKTGKYCLRSNVNWNPDYRSHSHILFNEGGNEKPITHAGLTDTPEELKELYMKYKPVVYDYDTRFKNHRYSGGISKTINCNNVIPETEESKSKLDYIDFDSKNCLDVRYKDLIGPVLPKTVDDLKKETLNIDRYGRAEDISFFIHTVVESFSSRISSNVDKELLKDRMFGIVCREYNLDHLLKQGLWSQLLEHFDGEHHETGVETSSINEGDVYVSRIMSDNYLVGYLNMKVLKIPTTSEWGVDLFWAGGESQRIGKSKTEAKPKVKPEIIIELEFEDDPFVTVSVLNKTDGILDGRPIIKNYFNERIMKCVYKKETLKRKDGKITMEMVITPQ